MLDFEHMMLLVCVAAAIGTAVGTLLRLLISLIGDLFSKQRVKKRRFKENNHQ